MKIYIKKIFGYESLGEFVEMCKNKKQKIVSVSYTGMVEEPNSEPAAMFIVKYESR